MASCVIALDVGGTAMKGALLGPDLAVLAELRRPTRPADPDGTGPEAGTGSQPAASTDPGQGVSADMIAGKGVGAGIDPALELGQVPDLDPILGQAAGVSAIVDSITNALADLRALATARNLSVRGAGVAVPGIVDEDSGRAVYSANLGWHDLPLAALLAERLGLPVALGHDVRAGARAEAAVGAARGVRDVLFVPIGTGIAGAAVYDGRTLSGGGFAGELGHLTVRPGGRRCRCGSRGCLETVASAAAVAARFRSRTGHSASGAADVVRWLDQGDRIAREIWDEAVAALADALAVAATLLAPELIVLGGGLAEAGDRLLLPLDARLAELLTFQRRPRLVRAALGDRAGCLGAGLLAWEQAGRAPAAQDPDPAVPGPDLVASAAPAHRTQNHLEESNAAHPDR